MASRIGDMVVDCADPERLAEFWCRVLGYRVFDRDETGVAIRGARTSPDILFIRVPEAKAVKNRIHFDVCPTDRDQATELARLLDLGASRSRVRAGSMRSPSSSRGCGRVLNTSTCRARNVSIRRTSRRRRRTPHAIAS